MAKTSGRRTRGPLFAGVVLVAFGSIALAQQRDVSRPPAGSAPPAAATLTGRVISADDGRPVRGATVQISGSGTPRNTLSDGDGGFTFQNLTAGSVTVSVSRPGFVTQRSGQRHALQPARPVQIAAGGRYAVEFVLLRGSAIAGTILDSFGDPVAGALVEVRRSRMVRGRRQLTTVTASDTTDDTGAFRVHSLPAGDYYVAARFTGMVASLSGWVTGGPPIGPPSYYPGTPSAADAQRIPLATGETRSGVVFSLVASRPVRVSGILVDPAGAPVDGASVELLDAASLSVVARSFGNFGETFDGGRFTMIDVSPGSYVLVAKVLRPSGPATAFLPVTVGGTEVSGVTLAAARGVTVDGTVTAVPGSTLPRADLAISARSMRGVDVQSEPGERGAFTLSGLVGPYALVVEGVPNGWTVQSIVINGTETADGVIDFPARGRMSARVVLTNHLTELTGTVTSDQAPAPDADVLIFPDDPARWTYPSRMVRTVRADASGRYRVAGLPPAARYLAVAVDGLDETEYQDPDVLERLRPRATAFSLGEGAKAAVDLMLARR